MRYKSGRIKYLQLTINGKNMPVHRHMMEAYLGRALNRDEHVHHINGNSLDNRIENLELLKAGVHSSCHFKGEGCGNSVLFEDTVRHIKLLLSLGIRTKELSELFGIKYSTIAAFKNGYSWKHVKPITSNLNTNKF